LHRPGASPPPISTSDTRVLPTDADNVPEGWAIRAAGVPYGVFQAGAREGVVMTQPAKVQEPSMEEILASIRWIIADDETKAKVAEPKPAPAAARPAPAPPRAPAAAPTRVSSPPPRPAPAGMNQDDIDTMLSGLDTPPAKSNGARAEDNPADVLDLTESMATPTPSPQPPVFRTIEGHSDVFFTEETAESTPDPFQSRADEPRRSFAPSAQDSSLISSSTSAAVDSAFNTLAHTVLSQNARTLEDLVKEMMRPMLKAWLDDNLPGLVERVVRAEIERVSRGRTG
jgi:cell pole-organizing protein PopZ